MAMEREKEIERERKVLAAAGSHSGQYWYFTSCSPSNMGLCEMWVKHDKTVINHPFGNGLYHLQKW